MMEGRWYEGPGYLLGSRMAASDLLPIWEYGHELLHHFWLISVPDDSLPSGTLADLLLPPQLRSTCF